MSRFNLALALFAVLGALSWLTLTDQRIRAVALLLIGLFAFRTWLHHKREMEDQKRDAK